MHDQRERQQMNSNTIDDMKLHQDLFELILQKLPVKSLLRLKLVSTQWKSTIESQYFKRQHLTCRESRDPDLLMVNSIDINLKNEEIITRPPVLGSLDVIKLPDLCPMMELISLEIFQELGFSFHYSYYICGCDGMICYYNHSNRLYVVNPMTRWVRSIPQARFQKVFHNMRKGRHEADFSLWNLGFGKEKFTNTYKLVWLYNSFELSLDNDTTCEVFDFSTNTWRFVTVAPIRILEDQDPVYLDGSLHWLTDENITQTKVLSFDIQIEKFHIITNTPFVDYACFTRIIMCNLNNHLCVSQKKWPLQEIWSLNSGMSWTKIYSLNLQTGPSCWYNALRHDYPCVFPVAVSKTKKSLVIFDDDSNLVIFDFNKKSFETFDLELRSYDFSLRRDYKVHGKNVVVSYFPSLMSIN